MPGALIRVRSHLFDLAGILEAAGAALALKIESLAEDADKDGGDDCKDNDYDDDNNGTTSVCVCSLNFCISQRSSACICHLAVS